MRKECDCLSKEKIMNSFDVSNPDIVTIMMKYYAENQDNLRLEALAKWIELAKTTHEIKLAYNETPDDSELEMVAWEKWNQITFEEVMKISNLQEAKRVYREAPPFSNISNIAFDILATFKNTI